MCACMCSLDSHSHDIEIWSDIYICVYTAIEVVSSAGIFTPEIQRPATGSQTHQIGGTTSPGHGENNLANTWFYSINSEACKLSLWSCPLMPLLTIDYLPLHTSRDSYHSAFSWSGCVTPCLSYWSSTYVWRSPTTPRYWGLYNAELNISTVSKGCVEWICPPRKWLNASELSSNTVLFCNSQRSIQVLVSFCAYPSMSPKGNVWWFDLNFLSLAPLSSGMWDEP